MYSESLASLNSSQEQLAQQSRGERGSMLLIALAVLTLLSIIAVTFVALMRLELKATENFRDQGKCQLLANSVGAAADIGRCSPGEGNRTGSSVG